MIKRRAVLTAKPTARMAGLKAQQFPTNGQELNPESNGPSVCPTVAAIQSLPLGSTVLVLVATHTRTIYQIIGNGTDEYFQRMKMVDFLGINIQMYGASININ